MIRTLALTLVLAFLGLVTLVGVQPRRERRDRVMDDWRARQDERIAGIRKAGL